ncbi:MAG: hypothetical protein SF123_00370 [Chloroflexota bacterium]|nr:hypothetical protein [Chloroflexota bacterium]
MTRRPYSDAETRVANARRGMERDDAIRYLADFDLDPALVGTAISAGRQHTIFVYDQTRVIKVPNKSLYMTIYGALHCEVVRRDVNLLARYVPQFLVPTQVLHSRQDAEDYVIMQEYLPTARFVTGDQFHRVRDQFAQMVEGNRQMMRAHGLSIDFFGNHSFRQSLVALLTGRKQRALLNNILLVDDGSAARLVITDVNLSELRLKLDADFSLSRWLIDNGIYWSSRWMIRALFGLPA